MEWAYERKMAWYADLKSQCEDRGWTYRVLPVEVGCRGFAGRSVGFLLISGLLLEQGGLWLEGYNRLLNLRLLGYGETVAGPTDTFLPFCCPLFPWWLLSGAAGVTHTFISYWNRLQKEGSMAFSWGWGMPSNAVSHTICFSWTFLVPKSWHEREHMQHEQQFNYPLSMLKRWLRETITWTLNTRERICHRNNNLCSILQRYVRRGLQENVE